MLSCLLLLLAGVSEKDILDDYEISTIFIYENIDKIRKEHPSFPENLGYSKRKYLENFLKLFFERYKTVENYLYLIGLNENQINAFCDECIKYLEKKLNTKAHGILSFDLKEDSNGDLKVTEVNIRHMAYTGVMAHVGFDLIEDTIRIMEDGSCDNVARDPYHQYDILIAGSYRELIHPLFQTQPARQCDGIAR